MLKARITWLTDSPEDNTFMKATTDTGMEISWSKSLADVPLRKRLIFCSINGPCLIYLFDFRKLYIGQKRKFWILYLYYFSLKFLAFFRDIFLLIFEELHEGSFFSWEIKKMFRRCRLVLNLLSFSNFARPQDFSIQ